MIFYYYNQLFCAFSVCKLYTSYSSLLFPDLVQKSQHQLISVMSWDPVITFNDEHESASTSEFCQNRYKWHRGWEWVVGERFGDGVLGKGRVKLEADHTHEGSRITHIAHAVS